MSNNDSPPTLPQCCSDHRMAGLDVIETLLTNDTLTNYDRMIEAGWPHEGALDALRGCYRSWLLTRFGDAIDIGLELLEIEAMA